ncbi:sulfotransferase domain-containing protein [Pontixanthobacter sp. CEM42]|uniref:sulfotransferase domain-containing protein n=1 Tax=Pontixanthobacter sp. CEM42 TaxID=2792077 RepID=UPI001ADF4597|nr:sulfotransferase domain-containing protein [Pontixanthobacter sp. CEM42]
MSTPFPNLYLAGAPKCGTTSFYDWLAQHPSIYAPQLKEPVYFGSDLTSGSGRYSEQDYLSAYERRTDEQYALDGSTHYFYAKEAPVEIAAKSPDSKIIIALRHPAEAVHSMFHQLRFNGAETLDDFQKSLEAEFPRAANPQPLRRGFPENLLYSRVYAMRENVQRFVAQFGRNNVRVILLDDLKSDAEGCLRETYKWLGLDPSIAASTNLATKNGAKRARSRMMQDLASYPPGWIGKFTRPLFKPETRYRIRSWLRQKNIAEAANPPMDDGCRAMLVERHANDVLWLESFLQRDLSHWKQ